MHNLGLLRLRRCARAIATAPALVVGLLLGLGVVFQPGEAARAATPRTCAKGDVDPQPNKSDVPDLLITGKCTIKQPADYYYADVRIIQGGELTFTEPAAGNKNIGFWARNILVENGGALIAGDDKTPYGAQGGTLTIFLYGENQNNKGDHEHQAGQGVLCHPSEGSGPCGIPKALWDDNGATLINGCGNASPGPNSKCIPGLLPTESDYFYQYGPLHGDGKCTNNETFNDGKCGTVSADGLVGYFGYKTLGVSYGGTLVLKGYKGATYNDKNDQDPLNPGGSWLRLAESLAPGNNELKLDHSPGTGCGLQPSETCGWHAGDKIVVTTTDYLPGHSEELTIDKIDGATITFHPAIKWNHNGTRFAIKARLDKAGATARLEAGGMDPELIEKGAETRAAVALLTRSIRIVSGGDAAGETFEKAGENSKNCKNGAKVPYCYSFGAQTAFRQGFAKVQIQGVEFENLGQAGRLGHYPVHFHMARKTPADTYVKDSSVNESMTRWYVIHSTLGVTLARNVGYKSIGHGYYFEDGTETDNKLYSNIGIFARAAVDHGDLPAELDHNPRKIPGILADKSAVTQFPFDSDYRAPSVFWITNGWNDFYGNMAAGAETAGTCYWFVAAANSDSPDVPTNANKDPAGGYDHQKWGPDVGGYKYGYAGLQRDQAGATPLRSFYKNYCTSAMHSFLDLNDASPGRNIGIEPPGASEPNKLRAVESFAPAPSVNRHYYPNADAGFFRKAVRCPFADGQYQCAGIKACSDGEGNEHCTATVLDHYTSAFHWAETNFSAIWLRPQWHLVENSVLSDVQNGGITIVTGGDYTHSSVIPGFWGVVRNNVFIGHTQPQDAAHSFARDSGPFNDDSRKLDPNAKCAVRGPPYCLNKGEGIGLSLANFSVGQRFFNIYDGPSYQDSNAFFDIRATPCATGDTSDCIYGITPTIPGVRKYTSGPDKDKCYMPNAAIAWKQPNGFIYPPAFHSTNLFFDNVELRHYVIEPLFQAPAGVTGKLDFGQGGTYLTDYKRTLEQYCGSLPNNVFTGFTGIDRQTSLNDDDGSLTGLTSKLETEPARPIQTISVNEDSFFNAPVKTSECKSNVGVDAAKACPKPQETPAPATALTSPYDYVTTVIVPGCSTDGGDCGTKDRGGEWSKECSSDFCYGVPLYRQFLTGNDGKDGKPRTREWAHWFDADCGNNRNTPQCRWPFMRMAGENFYQRNTLTVNHGTYFLDTSVPNAVQLSEKFTETEPRSVNVFKGGETYYVFFVYAKQSTEQDYQIYVGEDFGKDKGVDTVKGVRMNISSFPVRVAETFATRPNWLSEPTFSGGILTVHVNFKGVSELDPTADNLCQPKTFCRKDGTTGKCVSALVTNGPNKDPLLIADPSMEKHANGVCGTWAVKDLDCPKSGCLGFSFTLPGKFTPDATISGPTPHRPGPEMFPSGKPDWQTRFENTGTPPDNAAGVCFYPRPLPGSAGCEVE